MIIYVSEFDLTGGGSGGYTRIGTRLCNELVNRHNIGVMALGLGYNGEEHPYPYSITPVPAVSHITPMIKRLLSYGAPVEAVVVALDILMQEPLMQALQVPNQIPYIGLFPLEAPPLCQPWAIQLLRMDERLIMSEFGVKECEIAGVGATFIPIGVDDPAVWRPPSAEERTQIRAGLGIDDDTFVILTVADNQERKNLARAAEIVSEFSVEIESRAPNGFVTKKREKRKTLWQLVTRLDSPVGWKMDDLAMRCGIMDRSHFYNRGMPVKNLWALYASADAFLLTSKGEGLGIPVLEAMACRLPVVGTDACAIAEHLGDSRGWPVAIEYEHVDPFGNELRYWASTEDGAACLEEVAKARSDGSISVVLDAAEAYVRGRTWEQAGQVLYEAIDRAARAKGTRLLDEQAKEKPGTELHASAAELVPAAG